jgi:hypothetical protein
VGITVEMGGFRDERCRPLITKGSRRQPGPVVDTGRDAGARWSWFVPGNVGAGQWTLAVTCSGGRRPRHAKTTFFAAAGIGPHAAGLWLPRSMHHEAVRLQPPGEGNGGGEGSLYPFGQCTWWVARKRPDLPYFPRQGGDALNWATSAAAAGFPVGEVPLVGSVAVFATGQYGAGRYGHVAYVTAVEGSQITISEANFRARRGEDTRTISASGLRFIYRKGESPRLPVEEPPRVELLSPSPGATVSGQVPLRASSNAAGVLFEVFYFSNPSDPNSGTQVRVGEDSTPGDGFSAAWESSGVPNQGGPGGHSVLLKATALDAAGIPTTESASVRVNLANSRTEGGVTFYPYYVVNTCFEGECGLHLRSGPGFSSYPSTGKRYDGEELDLVCQAHGENFTSEKTGESSDIWDRLTSGEWASDYYVDTPDRGLLSPPLPICP